MIKLLLLPYYYLDKTYDLICTYWSITTKLGVYSSFIFTTFFTLNHWYKNGYNSIIRFNIQNPYTNNNIIITTSKLKFIFYCVILSGCITPIIIPVFLSLIVEKIFLYIAYRTYRSPRKIAENLYKTRKYIISEFKENKPDVCPVCLNNSLDESDKLTCGHYIHRNCFLLTDKTICPICQQEVYLTIDELEEIIKKNYNNFIKD